jgi:hypothetical protein
VLVWRAVPRARRAKTADSPASPLRHPGYHGERPCARCTAERERVTAPRDEKGRYEE